jgi:hypothetical protein
MTEPNNAASAGAEAPGDSALGELIAKSLEAIAPKILAAVAPRLPEIIARVVADHFTIALYASRLESAAIVGALAQRGLVDPELIAKWADTFAGARPTGALPPAVQEGGAAALRDFAEMIRNMARKPAEGSAMRQ